MSTDHSRVLNRLKAQINTYKLLNGGSHEKLDQFYNVLSAACQRKLVSDGEKSAFEGGARTKQISSKGKTLPGKQKRGGPKLREKKQIRPEFPPEKVKQIQKNEGYWFADLLKKSRPSYVSEVNWNDSLCSDREESLKYFLKKVDRVIFIITNHWFELAEQEQQLFKNKFMTFFNVFKEWEKVKTNMKKLYEEKKDLFVPNGGKGGIYKLKELKGKDMLKDKNKLRREVLQELKKYNNTREKTKKIRAFWNKSDKPFKCFVCTEWFDDELKRIFNDDSDCLIPLGDIEITNKWLLRFSILTPEQKNKVQGDSDYAEKYEKLIKLMQVMKEKAKKWTTRLSNCNPNKYGRTLELFRDEYHNVVNYDEFTKPAGFSETTWTNWKNGWKEFANIYWNACITGQLQNMDHLVNQPFQKVGCEGAWFYNAYPREAAYSLPLPYFKQEGPADRPAPWMGGGLFVLQNEFVMTHKGAFAFKITDPSENPFNEDGDDNQKTLSAMWYNANNANKEEELSEDLKLFELNQRYVRADMFDLVKFYFSRQEGKKKDTWIGAAPMMLDLTTWKNFRLIRRKYAVRNSKGHPTVYQLQNVLKSYVVSKITGNNFPTFLELSTNLYRLRNRLPYKLRGGNDNSDEPVLVEQDASTKLIQLIINGINVDDIKLESERFKNLLKSKPTLTVLRQFRQGKTRIQERHELQGDEKNRAIARSMLNGLEKDLRPQVEKEVSRRQKENLLNNSDLVDKLIQIYTHIQQLKQQNQQQKRAERNTGSSNTRSLKSAEDYIRTIGSDPKCDRRRIQRFFKAYLRSSDVGNAKDKITEFIKSECLKRKFRSKTVKEACKPAEDGSADYTRVANAIMTLWGLSDSNGPQLNVNNENFPRLDEPRSNYDYIQKQIINYLEGNNLCEQALARKTRSSASSSAYKENMKQFTVQLQKMIGELYGEEFDRTELNDVIWKKLKVATIAMIQASKLVRIAENGQTKTLNVSDISKWEEAILPALDNVEPIPESLLATVFNHEDFKYAVATHHNKRFTTSFPLSKIETILQTYKYRVIQNDSSSDLEGGAKLRYPPARGEAGKAFREVQCDMAYQLEDLLKEAFLYYVTNILQNNDNDEIRKRAHESLLLLRLLTTGSMDAYKNPSRMPEISRLTCRPDTPKVTTRPCYRKFNPNKKTFWGELGIGERLREKECGNAVPAKRAPRRGQPTASNKPSISESTSVSSSSSDDGSSSTNNKSKSKPVSNKSTSELRSASKESASASSESASASSESASDSRGSEADSKGSASGSSESASGSSESKSSSSESASDSSSQLPSSLASLFESDSSSDSSYVPSETESESDIRRNRRNKKRPSKRKQSIARNNSYNTQSDSDSSSDNLEIDFSQLDNPQPDNTPVRRSTRARRQTVPYNVQSFGGGHKHWVFQEGSPFANF